MFTLQPCRLRRSVLSAHGEPVTLAWDELLARFRPGLEGSRRLRAVSPGDYIGLVGPQRRLAILSNLPKGDLSALPDPSKLPAATDEFYRVARVARTGSVVETTESAGA